ncbi:large conductance mechanosensitive channel protein MscL [Maribacter sp. TH_r10]|uniref:Large-conductance mechanosensitive channel n=1 Tax=Maribacter luteus TaxID=2594478 RepID=A0A6I2MKQ5_9FLAO|nr:MULTISPECIES: large conductance mechanosensitive channel protein MscL [Maribacter]MDV7137734.1 large conductance mechanosensitive channel protein MscL [Maribacter sp. TH_r10]MRX63095.1 large conductance mechanosensitive channel protein MscL [Maribacter luteus]|tara:strand:+ start:11542 stop:11946 length:405 start_codon:yes stop_codon:yes gene_type:complete
MLKEFKNFIMTGNVIDFAVAVILAGAVGLVVNGFVADIIMPIVGHFAGGMDFANLKIVLTEASGVEGEAGYVAENAIRWGKWVNAIVNLLIVGFVMFIIVKAYNKTKTPPAPEAPAGPSQEDLLAEIRDLLKKQ